MKQISALPQVSVQVNGEPLSREDARSLGEVRVQQRLSLPSLCELTFFEPGGALSKGSALPPGSKIRVEVRGGGLPLFEGEITAVEYCYDASHKREVRVRGYDSLHRLRKRQPVRAHVQVTAEDLARELVADLGLSVDAGEAGPIFQRIIQHRQSDFELLSETAEQSGLYFTVRGDVLHLLTLEGLDDVVPLILGDSLLEARIEVNGDSACTSVDASGWNPFTAERHQGSATTPRSGRRVDAGVDPDQVGGTGERTLTNQIVQSDVQAEALAQALLDLRTGSEVVLWGVAEGDARLRPGTRVDIKDVAPPLAGEYLLTAVNHLIDGVKGFVSELSSAPPIRGHRPGGAGLALGIVTSVNDPDGLGRIEVSLPALGDTVTEWMGVLCPGAGRHKGLVALPDVEDQVLLLLNREDPSQGVILGGLYGTFESPDWGVEETSVRRYTFGTPGGQVVRLDDGKQKIRVENSRGSYVELAPEKVMIHAATDLDIEAPGRSVVIRGQSIDFERI